MRFLIAISTLLLCAESFFQQWVGKFSKHLIKE